MRLTRRSLVLLSAVVSIGLAGCSEGDVDEGDGRPVVAVVGDSYTAGVEVGGLGATNWTARLDDLLRRDGYRVDMVVEAGGGSGYVATGWRNLTFGQMAVRGVPRDADVVIVFGSINDSLAASEPQQVRRSARELYDWLAANRPDATLIVIGPSPIGDDVDPALATISRAVVTAAEAAGATAIDPVADRWFSGDAASLISIDQLHPTDEGHVYMAEAVAPVVESVLDERAADG